MSGRSILNGHENNKIENLWWLQEGEWLYPKLLLDTVQSVCECVYIVITPDKQAAFPSHLSIMLQSDVQQS